MQQNANQVEPKHTGSTRLPCIQTRRRRASFYRRVKPLNNNTPLVPQSRRLLKVQRVLKKQVQNHNTEEADWNLVPITKAFQHDIQVREEYNISSSALPNVPHRLSKESKFSHEIEKVVKVTELRHGDCRGPREFVYRKLQWVFTWRFVQLATAEKLKKHLGHIRKRSNYKLASQVLSPAHFCSFVAGCGVYRELKSSDAVEASSILNGIHNALDLTRTRLCDFRLFLCICRSLVYPLESFTARMDWTFDTWEDFDSKTICMRDLWDVLWLPAIYDSAKDHISKVMTCYLVDAFPAVDTAVRAEEKKKGRMLNVMEKAQTVRLVPIRFSRLEFQKLYQHQQVSKCLREKQWLVMPDSVRLSRWQKQEEVHYQSVRQLDVRIRTKETLRIWQDTKLRRIFDRWAYFRVDTQDKRRLLGLGKSHFFTTHLTASLKFWLWWTGERKVLRNKKKRALRFLNKCLLQKYFQILWKHLQYIRSCNQIRKKELQTLRVEYARRLFKALQRYVERCLHEIRKVVFLKWKKMHEDEQKVEDYALEHYNRKLASKLFHYWKEENHNSNLEKEAVQRQKLFLARIRADDAELQEQLDIKFAKQLKENEEQTAKHEYDETLQKQAELASKKAKQRQIKLVQRYKRRYVKGKAQEDLFFQLKKEAELAAEQVIQNATIEAETFIESKEGLSLLKGKAKHLKKWLKHPYNWETAEIKRRLRPKSDNPLYKGSWRVKYDEITRKKVLYKYPHGEELFPGKVTTKVALECEKTHYLAEKVEEAQARSEYVAKNIMERGVKGNAATTISTFWRRVIHRRILQRMLATTGLRRKHQQQAKEEKAARMLQRLWRTRAAWLQVVKRAQQVWVPRIDPLSGSVYYYNTLTAESRWQKPAIMHRQRLTEPLPTWCTRYNEATGTYYYSNLENEMVLEVYPPGYLMCQVCYIYFARRICLGCRDSYRDEQLLLQQRGEDYYAVEDDVPTHAYCFDCWNNSHAPGADHYFQALQVRAIMCKTCGYRYRANNDRKCDPCRLGTS